MEQLQERILVYGSAGSGKTTAWLSLARKFPESTFHCIDTDASIDRMLQTEFRDLKNVKVYPARSWEKCKLALSFIKREVKPNDWLVVDMLDSVWDFVQGYFTEQIFNKEIDTYFLEVRKKAQGKSTLEALEGWTDWVVINKLYQSWINEIMYELPCNVFVTAKADKLSAKKESQENLDMFSSIGYKAEGEKRNSYRTHTVLFLCHNIDNTYLMTTIKDRGRKKFFAEQVTNFAEQYTEIMQGKEGSEEIK